MPYTSQAQAGYFHTHKAELEKQGVDVSEWDRKTKGKKLPKRAKKHNDVGMVPGDCPGSVSALSATLTNLIEMDYASAEARLLKRAKELGMERQFFPGGHVPAPSAQAKPNPLLRRPKKGHYPERSEDSRSLSMKLDKLIQFGNDPRPRNSLGEYSQQQEGVADPNSMAKTYSNPTSSTGGIARAAAVGGAAGTVGAGAAKGVGSAIKALYGKLHVKK